MAATSITMSKFIAGLIITILVASAISAGIAVSTQLITGPRGPQGEQGETGPQGPQGEQGETGATGPAGSAGAAGSQGSQGPAGVNGATWLNGTGVPSSSLGSNGDFYLNLANSDVYNKISGSWVWVANIRGATGAQGDRGFGVPQKGNISVSAFAFVPSNYYDNVSYLQDYGLRNLNDADPIVCMASLQLPHGATITNVTFYFHDYGIDYLSFRLVRENQTGFTQMGYVDNSGSSKLGDDHISLSSILYPTTDNNQYYYYLYIVIPSSPNPFDYQFHYALIEYEYPA